MAWHQSSLFVDRPDRRAAPPPTTTTIIIHHQRPAFVIIIHHSSSFITPYHILSLSSPFFSLMIILLSDTDKTHLSTLSGFLTRTGTVAQSVPANRRERILGRRHVLLAGKFLGSRKRTGDNFHSETTRIIGIHVV